jgi:hypothetical protein
MQKINNFFHISVLAIFIIFFPLTVCANTEYLFNKIVFFGDSLTDNGNLYSFDFGFLPKSPPYFKGQFSNGFPWSYQVTKYFKEKGSIGVPGSC